MSTALTQEQKDRIQVVKNKWKAIIADYKGDEKKAEAAALKIYEESECHAPRKIYWFSSAIQANMVLDSMNKCSNLPKQFVGSMSRMAKRLCNVDVFPHASRKYRDLPDEYHKFADEGMDYKRTLEGVFASRDVKKEAIESAIRAMVGPITAKSIAGANLLPENFDSAQTGRWWNGGPNPSFSLAHLHPKDEELECAAVDEKYVGKTYEEDFCRTVFAAWFFTNVCILVRKPVTMGVNSEGRLHSDNGPALVWQDGTKQYFLNGVSVTEEIAMTPGEKLDPHLIPNTKNAEMRREIVRKIGIERVCTKLGAKAIDAWTEPVMGNSYELLALDIGIKGKDAGRRGKEAEEPVIYLYLKMKNPSVEGVYHLEGVCPGITTCQQALNFRNGFVREQDLAAPSEWDTIDTKERRRLAQNLQFVAPVTLT